MNKHDERCPNCGRFVERDADGFYDRLKRDDDCAEVREFCNKACADKYHENQDCFNDCAERGFTEKRDAKPNIEEGATLGALMEKHQAQHSPLPWRYQRGWANGGYVIQNVAHVTNEADAKLIVASVNSAEKLAEALRDLETLAQCTVPAQDIAGHLRAMERKAREALAQWEGQ